ncbi:uncharacterized protein SPAPADRAFT_137172 [Spathaspora passalidarum NRRL Y-27907]|uniref:mRNA export factor GLE1 n=1 Tax=Spathaspora passalidarum (strain NRRL Y-27907 / 11-Y1) TaxID=619300 RepID=G3AKS3_SPAPN|nr:uncharacterized protein SPAPADRAFT_137172 [Spathaspora passalidarum NRRL Y-27907]EGW32977.1 hypothetical protein SPAPADRAFT_137172 [Spathaspora passalidarum NRRL Y-27907]
MRFGLPADFEIYVDVPPAPPAPPSSASGATALAPAALSRAILRLKSEPNAVSPIHNQFTEVFQAIENHTEELVAVNQIQQDKDQILLLDKINQHDQLAQANVTWLANKIDQSLHIQNSRVQEIILIEKERLRKEEERKRREEEERKRREEEERKRLEEEQRRLEEERKRKEEEERKYKEEEERKLKEEEQRKKELEEKKKQELAKKKKEQEEAKRQQELQKAKQQASLTDFLRIEKDFIKYKQDIVDIKTNIVEKLNSNKDLKKVVNAHKRKINPKFGQLSNSLTQLHKITQEVVHLITQTKSDDLAFNWILNFVAKAVVDQAETEIIVHATQAIPLAKLAYSLLVEFPEFEYYLSARFVKKCPYIIGYTCDISTEEGRKRMGWKFRDGKWEDAVKYDERVAGICTVWSVMSRLTDFPQQIPFYSFEATWKFLARMGNTELDLLSNTHFAILSNWWECAGKFFSSRFGRQSQKLMMVLVADLTNAVADRKYPSAVRLRIMGEEWLQHGKIESIKEMEP